MIKRISLNENDAIHLYELSLQHFQPGCGACDPLKERLEKFIGAKAVRWVKRVIKKHPY